MFFVYIVITVNNELCKIPVITQFNLLFCRLCIFDNTFDFLSEKFIPDIIFSSYTPYKFIFFCNIRIFNKIFEKPVCVIIENRRIAIEQAIEIANKDDIILILGKGHEQFMASTIGNEPYPGDKFIAMSAIKRIYSQGANY